MPSASRRRAHIAMVGIPAVSHVLPSLEIIRELVARGHRVTYANDPAVAGLITPTGAELVPCTSVLPVAELRAAARAEGGTRRAADLIEGVLDEGF